MHWFHIWRALIIPVFYHIRQCAISVLVTYVCVLFANDVRYLIHTVPTVWTDNPQQKTNLYAHYTLSSFVIIFQTLLKVLCDLRLHGNYIVNYKYVGSHFFGCFYNKIYLVNIVIRHQNYGCTPIRCIRPTAIFNIVPKPLIFIIVVYQPRLL